MFFNKFKKENEKIVYSLETTKNYSDFQKNTEKYIKKIIDNEDKLEASQRFHEFITRLDHRYKSLKEWEYLLSIASELKTETPISAIQLEFVNRIEAYYQQVYASMSALLMFINQTGSYNLKTGLSISSIKKSLVFLENIEKINLSKETKLLESARDFRSKFVDHIQQHTLHDWITYAFPRNNQIICVVIYFIRSKNNEYKSEEGGLFYDPYNTDFKLNIPNDGFYVSPPHDEIHQAFFSFCEKIINKISEECSTQEALN